MCYLVTKYFVCTQPGQVFLPIAPYIPSCVGGAGADLPTYKTRTFFSYAPLALSVSIFNKKSHRTRAVVTIIWSNFQSFHSSCLMTFFVKNWHN